MRLTDIAHQACLPFLYDGAIAIDATIGNGYDSCFLSHHISPKGQLFGFDIQFQALETTASRLASTQLPRENIHLFLKSHAFMKQCIPAQFFKCIDLVIFNLGYLPNSSHAITTTPESTLAALYQSAELLKPGGAISITAYRGHAGALKEFEAVESFSKDKSNPLTLIKYVPTGNPDNPGPVFFLLQNRS